MHLVYVRDRTEPSMPPWDDVKERVQEDWVAEKREEFVEQYYERLRERYEVVIDR